MWRITIFETILWCVCVCVFRVVLWFFNHELVVKYTYTASNIVCLLAYQVNRMYIVLLYKDTRIQYNIHIQHHIVCFILPGCDTYNRFQHCKQFYINLKYHRIYVITYISTFKLIQFNLYSSAKRFRFCYSMN